MFFSAEDDDGDFMSPSFGGSKLGALFGIDKAGSTGGNDSLQYSAPKQPKSKKDVIKSLEEAANSTQILTATAVQAYKYIDGQYANQGKLGAAVIGNHGAKEYKILLYVSKQQHAATARITSAFTFTIQANNYASFYDDTRQTWSLLFDSEQVAIQFAKSICIAKACSMPSLDAVISQDLHVGEGGTLESGDSAEVKYTGWFLQNFTFGEVFDSNTSSDKLFRFKLGKGKVIKGWDEGMVGMTKNMKRMLVIPPSLAYGSQGMSSRVPPNSTLIFEVEVVRVKLAKEASNTASGTPSPAPTPEPITRRESTSEDVKTRTKSISEQLSHSPKSDKAKLISRMAKMGQPMLPAQGGTPSSDDETGPYEEVQEDHHEHVSQPSHHAQKPRLPAHKPHQAVHQQPQYVQQQPVVQQPVMQPVMQQPDVQPNAALALYQPLHQNPAYSQAYGGNMMQPPQYPQQAQQTQYGMPYQQPQQQQPMYPGMPGQMLPPTNPMMGQPGSDMHTPMLLSETRQQNTELRVSIGKVSDKIEELSKKMDHMQVHSSNNAMALPGSLPNMEAGVILQNIQKIVQENERLKKDLFEKGARIESQNEKIAELLQRNQAFVEQSNTLLEQRNDTFKQTATSSQSRVLSLEQEKVQLTTELAASMSQISTIQLELNTIRKKEVDVRQQLSSSQTEGQSHREQINMLCSQQTDLEKKVEQLQQSVKEEKLGRKQAESQVATLTEELSDSKSNNEALEKNVSERKKKASSERKKMEEEMEEIKTQLEEEVQSLKDKLRRQKTSTDSVTAEQVANVEEDLNRDWKEKSDRLLKAADNKYQRHVQEITEEKNVLQQTIVTLEEKLSTFKSNHQDSSRTVESLQTKVEEMSSWKNKYDNLRSQAATMKQKYEERIDELTSEIEEAVSQEEEYREEISRLKRNVQTLSSKVAGAGEGHMSNDTLIIEVKKIMNSVFQNLKENFQQEELYKGADILKSMLNTIKTVTLKLSQKSKDLESEESADEEDEEEDEQEDEQEDEEEDEQEDEQEDEEDEQEDEKINGEMKEEIGGETKKEKVEVEEPVKEENIQETENLQFLDDNEESTEEYETGEESADESKAKIEDKERIPSDASGDEDSITDVESVKTSDNIDVSNKEHTSTSDTNIVQSGHDTSSTDTVETISPGEVVNGAEDDTEEHTDDVIEDTKQEVAVVTDEIVDSEKKNVIENGTDNSNEDTTHSEPNLNDDTGTIKKDDVKDNKDMGPIFGTDSDEEDNKQLFGLNSKKIEETETQAVDDDMKPKPPPPLFGDDDDDDDLDWLS